MHNMRPDIRALRTELTAILSLSFSSRGEIALEIPQRTLVVLHDVGKLARFLALFRRDAARTMIEGLELLVLLGLGGKLLLKRLALELSLRGFRGRVWRRLLFSENRALLLLELREE